METKRPVRSCGLCLEMKGRGYYISSGGEAERTAIRKNFRNGRAGRGQQSNIKHEGGRRGIQWVLNFRFEHCADDEVPQWVRERVLTSFRGLLLGYLVHNEVYGSVTSSCLLVFQNLFLTETAASLFSDIVPNNWSEWKVVCLSEILLAQRN